MRTKRVPHNHIAQGVTEGCPACLLIRTGIGSRFACDLLRADDPNKLKILGPAPQP